jgi:hypothetical protein
VKIKDLDKKCSIRYTRSMKTKNTELQELKQLVSEFLDAIYYVPFRAVDCNQQLVEDLWEKLAEAVDNHKSRK